MSRKNGMGAHQSAKMKNDEWLTPPAVLEKLGTFDLDPCSPIARPWNTARVHFSKEQDGLAQQWFGRVWCNPPYGKEAALWLEKLSNHNQGIALIFARTETDMFFRWVWRKASAVLFIQGRLYFYDVNGRVAPANSGAPSVLVAYGSRDKEILRMCGIPGKFIEL